MKILVPPRTCLARGDREVGANGQFLAVPRAAGRTGLAAQELLPQFRVGSGLPGLPGHRGRRVVIQVVPASTAAAAATIAAPAKVRASASASP
jgi:hypothetical protein